MTLTSGVPAADDTVVLLDVVGFVARMVGDVAAAVSRRRMLAPPPG